MLTRTDSLEEIFSTHRLLISAYGYDLVKFELDSKPGYLLTVTLSATESSALADVQQLRMVLTSRFRLASAQVTRVGEPDAHTYEIRCIRCLER